MLYYTLQMHLLKLNLSEEKENMSASIRVSGMKGQTKYVFRISS